MLAAAALLPPRIFYAPPGRGGGRKRADLMTKSTPFGFTVDATLPGRAARAGRAADAARRHAHPGCSCRSAPRPASRRWRPTTCTAWARTCVLGNTYHLYLRPGDELIARAGRAAPLHGLGRPDADRQRRLPGVQPQPQPQDRRRRRHLPVAHRRLAATASRPKRSIAAEEQLGADIIMALDECTPYPSDARLQPPGAGAAPTPGPRAAGRRTRGTDQALFGIVQGGVYPDLRQRERRAS